MRGIHLSFMKRIFYLWGEEPREEPLSPLPPLSKHLAQAGLLASPRRTPLVRNTLWLPSRGGVALPSSPLLGEEPDRRRKISLEPFSIPTLPLTLQEMKELFRTDSLEPPPGSALLLGPSLFWAFRLFRLTENLIARESYLPSLMQGDSFWEARWIPVLPEEMEKEMEHLGESLPGALRCMAQEEGKAPEIAPREHTREMLFTLLDGLIRLCLGRENKVKSSAQSFPSLHDAWLEALSTPSPKVLWKKEEELRE